MICLIVFNSVDNLSKIVAMGTTTRITAIPRATGDIYSLDLHIASYGRKEERIYRLTKQANGFRLDWLTPCCHNFFRVDSKGDIRCSKCGLKYANLRGIVIKWSSSRVAECLEIIPSMGDDPLRHTLLLQRVALQLDQMLLREISWKDINRKVELAL